MNLQATKFEKRMKDMVTGYNNAIFSSSRQNFTMILFKATTIKRDGTMKEDSCDKIPMKIHKTSGRGLLIVTSDFK